MVSEAKTCPHAGGSLAATADREPWPLYRELREAGEVVWDDELNAWLVLSYDACKQVLRSDDSAFDVPHEDEGHLEISGASKVNNLHGEHHDRNHAWWMRVFSPRAVEEYRPLIRTIVQDSIDPFAPRGRAELVSELAERVSFRVIAAVMGLPWQDDDFVEDFGRDLRIVMRFVDRQYDQNASELLREALEASRNMKQLVLPYVDARYDGSSDDIIGRLVKDGPSLLENWGQQQTLENVYATFSSGMDTTSSAMSNGFHMMLTQPRLIDDLRAGADGTIERFTEEVLRLEGTVHFRPRIAQSDCEVAGTPIKQDDRLLVLFMAAGRDGEHYTSPDDVVLDRSAPRDHLGFAFGPRTCIGMAVARAEIQEGVRAVVEQLPGLRLDEEAPPPQFRGFILRSYRPLHVVFDATADE